MTEERFDPRLLPGPDVLRRRHVALLLVAECLEGRESPNVGFYVRTSSAGGELLWWEDGSGSEYGLVLDGGEALLWVFDRESPYSPWLHDDEPQDWPGMLDGLPEPLSAHLPVADGRSPRSISGCFWYTDGRWHMGSPEPAEDTEEWPDPQGVWVIGGLLDLDEGVSQLVQDYDTADRLVDDDEESDVAPAAALAARVEAGEPVTEDALAALSPVDSVPVMLERAQALIRATG